MFNVDRFCLVEHLFRRLGLNNTSRIQPHVLSGLGKKVLLLLISASSREAGNLYKQIIYHSHQG